MAVLEDAEFGSIKLRRSALAHSVRLKLDAGGSITISLPKRAPLYLAKQLLDESRDSLRKNLQTIQQKRRAYMPGDLIGKSHLLRLEPAASEGNVVVRGSEVIVFVPQHISPADDFAQRLIKKGMTKALRIQAKAYLPRRLAQLAAMHGFNYTNVRFSSAGTRWGSCSAQGTISLNIWLMQLPHELIDYVLTHELCHTRHMNHSQDFWQLVQQLCPDFKQYRRTLKTYQPYA